jgi:hypothetical protein
MYRNIKTYVALLTMVFSLVAFARADEIQFTTLPQVVRSTVIRETHIPGPTAVTHVVVTAPTTITTTTGPVEQQVTTDEQVQQDLPRYQLIEKKGDKEVYLDRQTGQKVKVKRED